MSYTMMGDLMENQHNFNKSIEYYEMALARLGEDDSKKEQDYRSKIKSLQKRLKNK